MIVYTGRVGYKGLDGIDITIKSATTKAGQFFAPRWDMVMDYKRRKIDSREYTIQYYLLLRDRFKDPETREAVYELLKRRHATLCCYCAKDTFCHRLLAVDILEKIANEWGVEFVRGGER